MEDELDQLIEGAIYGAEDSEEAPESHVSPEDAEATADTAEHDDTQDTADESEAVESDPQDDTLPDDDPDGTGETPEEPSPAPPAPDPERLKLQQTVEQQQNVIRRMLEGAQQAQVEQQREAALAAEKHERETLEAKWADMDPDDAADERVKYMAQNFQKREQALQQERQEAINRAQQLEQQQAQQAEYAKQMQARDLTIDYIKNEFSLTDSEVEDMSDYDDPYKMESFAKRAKARRQQQTHSARETKRKNFENNPALRSGGSGQAAVVQQKEAKDLDEFVDNLLTF